MSDDKMAKLLLLGESCKTCLYYQIRGFTPICERNIAIGGSTQKLPKERICTEWSSNKA